MGLPRLNAPPQPRSYRRVAALPVLLAALGLVAAGGPQASAASGASCSASYGTQAQWSGGFVSMVTLSNTGTTALTSWTVTFTFRGDQTVTFQWGTTATQSGESVTAANLSYDASVAVGGHAWFGFNGTWSSSDAPPASLTCTPAN